MFIDLDVLNLTEHADLIEFVHFVLSFAITISALIAVISLVITGFKYIFSMGDDEKVKEATRSLAFSLVGLIIVFLSPTIIEFIINEILVR